MRRCGVDEELDVRKAVMPMLLLDGYLLTHDKYEIEAYGWMGLTNLGHLGTNTSVGGKGQTQSLSEEAYYIEIKGLGEWCQWQHEGWINEFL